MQVCSLLSHCSINFIEGELYMYLILYVLICKNYNLSWITQPCRSQCWRQIPRISVTINNCRPYARLLCDGEHLYVLTRQNGGIYMGIRITRRYRLHGENGTMYNRWAKIRAHKRFLRLVALLMYIILASTGRGRIFHSFLYSSDR